VGDVVTSLAPTWRKHLFDHRGPPLLLLGAPAWYGDRAALAPAHEVFLKAKGLTFPAVAPSFLYNADFWLWHAPPLYNATLENQGVHTSWNVGSLRRLWRDKLVAHLARKPWKRVTTPLSGARYSISFSVACHPASPLGAGLTFSRCHAPYMAAPRIWGISAATRVNGWVASSHVVPGGILYIIISGPLRFVGCSSKRSQQQAQEAQNIRMSLSRSGIAKGG